MNDITLQGGEHFCDSMIKGCMTEGALNLDDIIYERPMVIKKQ